MSTESDIIGDVERLYLVTKNVGSHETGRVERRSS